MSMWMILRGRSIDRFAAGSLIGRLCSTDQARKPGLTTVDAIHAIHSRTANGKPPPELPEGQARSILSDEGLPVEIARSLTRSAFEGDDRASVISQRWFIAEIFSHPEDIVRPVDQRLLAH
jgi:hypothetical protein